MATRKVTWTESAKEERKNILEFWIIKTKSKTYSKKLNTLFNDAINSILNFPKMGRISSDGKVRIKVVRDYLIFYELNHKEIIILAIWDARRDENDSGYKYS